MPLPWHSQIFYRTKCTVRTASWIMVCPCRVCRSSDVPQCCILCCDDWRRRTHATACCQLGYDIIIAVHQIYTPIAPLGITAGTVVIVYKVKTKMTTNKNDSQCWRWLWLPWGYALCQLSYSGQKVLIFDMTGWVLEFSSLRWALLCFPELNLIDDQLTSRDTTVKYGYGVTFFTLLYEPSGNHY